MSQLLFENFSLPGLSLEFGNLGTLGQLDSAVAMVLHEAPPNADGALQQRRSSVLVNFVDTRLGAPESHLIAGGGGGVGSAPMQVEQPRGSVPQAQGEAWSPVAGV